MSLKNKLLNMLTRL